MGLGLEFRMREAMPCRSFDLGEGGQANQVGTCGSLSLKSILRSILLICADGQRRILVCVVLLGYLEIVSTAQNVIRSLARFNEPCLLSWAALGALDPKLPWSYLPSST